MWENLEGYVLIGLFDWRKEGVVFFDWLEWLYVCCVCDIILWGLFNDCLNMFCFFGVRNIRFF